MIQEQSDTGYNNVLPNKATCGDPRKGGQPTRQAGPNIALRAPKVTISVGAALGVDERYQMAGIRYRSDISGHDDLGVGDLYHPDLARAGRKPGRDPHRGHHQRVRV